MSADIPSNTPENRELLDDNARKFITEPLSEQFFDSKHVTSFVLTVDWLETGEANETKLAHKTFADGTVEILLITKTTVDGRRQTVKEAITDATYRELAIGSTLHLEKTRYEFIYEQGGIAYAMKYDVFTDEKLRMLETDAPSDEKRAAFVPEDFPAKLSEVTGNLNYYGYRVCDIL